MKKIELAYRIYCYLGSAILLLGCSGKESTPGAQSSRNGSTNIPDTSSLAVSVTTEPVLSYEQHQGKYLYTKYCAVCHGEGGKGDGFNAFNLDPKPRDFTNAKYMNELTDARIMQTISGGGRSVNRSPLMPTWGGRMTKEEISYVVSYIRVFASQK